jgi:hypothetical protein
VPKYADKSIGIYHCRLNTTCIAVDHITMAPKNEIPAYVLGVGLTKFIKPRQTRAYPEMGYEAGVKAMLDAQINYDDVETGVACYCYGDTTSGQRIFYQFGMSGYASWQQRFAS